MKKSIIYSICFVALSIGMSSCLHIEDEWINWESQYGKNEVPTFQPWCEMVDNINETTMRACMLPGGHTLDDELTGVAAQEEYMDTDDSTAVLMRTTGIDMITVAKNLFSYWHSDQSRSYCGSYMSTDENGKPIRLSGRLVLPHDGHVKRVLILSHFTIGADIEAPSRSFPLEAILAARGMAVVVPDYIGFGTSIDRVHPYLCNDLTAKNVADMYFAVLPFLERIGCKPEHDDIYLMGYSQGGATTVAVQRYLEQHYPDVKIRLNMAGGGPYDPCVTYDKMIEFDVSDYPCVLPMIIQGMKVGEHLDNLNLRDFLTPLVADHMDEWVNSKKYVVYQLTELYGTKRITQLMTKEAQNKVSPGMSDLYMALYNNTLTSGWMPRSPMYIFHSMDDNVVPYDNAILMRNMTQSIANVQYNYGHYGTHRVAMLRFLYTCINLLHEHGDIDSAF